MRFFSMPFGRQQPVNPPQKPAAPAAVAPEPELAPLRVHRSDRPDAVAMSVEDLVRRTPAVNMWDSLDDDDDEAGSAAMPLPLPTRAATQNRAKTRLLDQEEPVAVDDVFETAAPAQRAVGTKFPVGWLIVATGPGRGTGFALQSGVSQIGRGEDETISLNFGDTAISRSNHASVAYDAETHEFYIGHGGKLNMVRLNGKPVLTTEKLTSGDMIRIGETHLKFVALCDRDFNWSGTAQGTPGVQ